MRKFLMTTSRPFSLLLLLGLFLFACNKDKLLEAPSPTPTLKKDFGVSAADLEKTRQTLTGTNEKNFFDFGFAEKNNAKLLPISQGRDEQQLINAFAVEMINLNKTFHFVEKMTAKIGYPVWYRSLFFEDINTNDPILVLPFAHLTADSVSGFILASPRGPNPKWFSHIVTRRYIDSLIHINASVQNLDFEVAVLYRLDKELFGRETNRYKNWNNDDDNLAGFSVNDRCDDIYLIMTSIDCPPRVRPAPVNNELDFTKIEADDRGDCIRIVAYCSGSGNNPEPPSWTGDPTWTGSGVPPGTGGGYPSVITGPVSVTSAAFNQFWEDCQHTLNFEHGSDGHLITNSFQLSICNQINALNNAGLTNIYTLDALYHNPLLLPVVHTFMTNHSGNSKAAEISAFVTAAGLQTLKVEDLELLLNYPEIYNLFKQEIFKVGDDAEKKEEVVKMLNSLKSQITSYLNQNGTTAETTELISLHLQYLSEDPIFLQNNINANFPPIGSDDWANTFENANVWPWDTWKKLKAAEKALCKQYPTAAYKIFKNRPIAVQKQRAFWGSDLNVTWLGKGDAFLHTYFQAINTKAVGATLALAFANAHETEHPAVLHLETEMDLFNNGIGIGIGSSSAANTLNNDQIADLVHSKVLAGDCKYLSPVDHVLSPSYPRENPSSCSHCLNGILPNTVMKWTNE